MSRAAYDRARAEYIKHHNRSARLQLAWRLAGRIYFDGESIGLWKAFCDAYDRFFCIVRIRYKADRRILRIG